MNTVQQILQEAVRLPEDQRLTLVNRILSISEPHVSGDISEVWDLEIRDRIARYDQGETCTRSASEVISDLDHRLKL